MRVFIAIEMPEEVREELVRIQDKFSGLGKINFVKTFHLTLKFLGEISDDKVEGVKKRLKEVKFESFNVKLGGLGVFPHENYVRVMWVGLESERIIGLQRKIDDCLEGLFEREKRFSAHVTVGRVKFVNDKEGLKGMLKEEVKKIEFSVKGVKLIKSELTPEGPIYSDLEIYNF